MCFGTYKFLKKMIKKKITKVSQLLTMMKIDIANKYGVCFIEDETEAIA